MNATPGITERLKGISAISVVPFKEDLSIDYEAVAANFEYLVKHGMEVIVVGGNTGEYASCSPAENRGLVELAVRTVDGRALVVAGVGNDYPSAADAARHAEAAGADLVMIHHPPGPFLTQDGFFDYNRGIAEAVGLGVIPYIRTPQVSQDTLLRLAGLPNLTAVKYAVNDPQTLGALTAATADREDLAWICGTAESWAPVFHAMGATGFTSGLVNIAPEISKEMLAALRAGDFAAARKLWLRIKPFEDLRARRAGELNVPAVKEAMEQLGLASRRVRPPLSELNRDDRERVAEILERML